MKRNELVMKIGTRGVLVRVVIVKCIIHDEIVSVPKVFDK